MALLAGDALQTLGFEVLATRPRGEGYGAVRSEALALVARAAGVAGMAGGQALDLSETGREHSGAEARERLQEIHALKTGRLLSVAAELGGLYGQASEKTRRGIERYGRSIGLLFQIADDLLDVTASTETLGKTAGKDTAQAKLTYPALFGVEGTRLELERVLAEANDAATLVEGREGLLTALATWAARRDR
jgi:farnesyl diphosphate synthase